MSLPYRKYFIQVSILGFCVPLSTCFRVRTSIICVSSRGFNIIPIRGSLVAGADQKGCRTDD